MNITTMVVGRLQANCYIVACDKTKEAVIIDPGAEANQIVEKCRQSGYKLKYILNTHGHMDHVGGNSEIKRALGGKLGIHENDAVMLDVGLTQQNNSEISSNENFAEPDLYLHDGDNVRCGELTFSVLHTPGHTPGGVCFSVGESLFSGDTLFAGSVGRWDFPGGSYEDLMRSIQSKLVTLPEQTVVYPGHGQQTSIGFEKKHNPFLKST